MEMHDIEKSTRFLALFNTLREDDKDVVISISESLVERHKNNMTKTVSNDNDNKSHFGRRRKL